MPAFGLGTGSLNQPQGSDDRWMQNVILAFLRAGGRHIDTAVNYNNYGEIGEAIRLFLAEAGAHIRQELFVVSKIPEEEMGLREASRAVDRSLAELGLDYIDLMLVHWPQGREHLPCAQHRAETWRACRLGTWRALEQSKRAGKLRAIGVSNYEEHHLEELLAVAEIPPSVNQMELHPWWYHDRLIGFCASHNITVVAYSSLGVRAVPWAAPELDQSGALQDIAERHGRTQAQVLLRWATQHGAAVIPSTTRLPRMLENSAIFDFALDDGEMRMLDSLGLRSKVHADPRSIA